MLTAHDIPTGGLNNFVSPNSSLAPEEVVLVLHAVIMYTLGIVVRCWQTTAQNMLDSLLHWCWQVRDRHFGTMKDVLISNERECARLNIL